MCCHLCSAAIYCLDRIARHDRGHFSSDIRVLSLTAQPSLIRVTASTSLIRVNAKPSLLRVNAKPLLITGGDRQAVTDHILIRVTIRPSLDHY